MRHFCAEIVPRIRDRATAPFLVNVVGFGDVTPLLPLARIPEVRLIGAVRDVRPWMKETDAVIVPVRGGGKRANQYSRSFLIPGWGIGYLPSGPSLSGAGPSIVSLSTSGANSCSQFSIWS